MRRTTLVLAAIVSFSLWAMASPASAEGDPVVEAARAVLAGASGDARAKAEEVLRADPAAALRAFLSATTKRSAGGELVAPTAVPERRVPLPRPRVSGPKGGADTSADDVVQVFDVRDLTQGRMTAETLAARLRAVVGERLTVAVTESGALVARAPAAAQQAMRDFLDSLRRDTATIYQVDARLVVAPMTATVGTQVMRTRPGHVVDVDDPLARLEGWVRGGDVTILASPRIACLDGQTASMEIGRQISYVADFDVEVGMGEFICDPVIEVVWDGLAAKFTAWSTEASGMEDGGIHVGLNVVISDVEEPMGTFTTTLGAGTSPVTIQIPSFVKTEFSRLIVVEDGESTLVRLADGPDTRRLLLLTVRRIDVAAGAEDEDR